MPALAQGRRRGAERAVLLRLSYKRAGSTDDITACVLCPELSHSAVRMTAGVLAIRIAGCNEPAPTLKVDKVVHRSEHAL